MGQQQLLLVILVTIIVGIATVVAINTFGSAADAANIDAVRQDLASIAAAAQGHYMKPAMLGGGSRSFENFSFETIAVPGEVTDAANMTNENGDYEVTGGAAEGSSILTVVGTANNGTILTATIEPNSVEIVQTAAATE